MQQFINLKKLLSLASFFLSLYFNNSSAQNIWESTGQINGLTVEDVILTDDGEIIVSAYNSGIYFSNDNGQNWIKKQKGLKSEHSYATSIASGINGNVFVVVDNKLYRGNRSTDEWIPLSESVWAGSRLLTNDKGYLYFYEGGFDPKFKISLDQGDSFQKIPISASTYYIQKVILAGKNKNYYQTREGSYDLIYKMKDDGSGITEIYLDFGQIIDFLYHPRGYLFMLTSWNQLIRTDSLGAGKIVITAIPSDIKHFLIKPNGNLLFITLDGDYDSDDLGLTWNRKQTNLYKSVGQSDNLMYYSDNLFVIHHDCSINQLERTPDDGKTWTGFDVSFFNPWFEELFIDSKNIVFTSICGSSKYLYSNDAGISWKKLQTPNQSNKVRDLYSSTTGNLFILLNDSLYKSNDFGFSWSLVKLPNMTSVNCISGNQDNIIYIFGTGQSYMSRDGGEQWLPISSPGISVDKMLFHQDGTVFAYSVYSVVYSEDDGLHWSPVPFEIGYLYKLCLSDAGNIYFCGTVINSREEGIFVSYDKLKSYQLVSKSIYNDILIDHSGNLYGVYGLDTQPCDISKDGGKTWNSFDSGLPPDLYALNIALDKNNFLYCGVSLNAIYKTRAPLTDLVKTNDTYQSSLQFIASPNPVENKMTININNQNISSGHYKIIDLNGTEKLKGDFHSNHFTIDCSSLSNGMAFIQIFEKGKLYISGKIVITH